MGTLVSVPVSLLLAKAIVPFATVIKEYGDPVFFIGAIVLALLSKKRWVALASIIPFALLIQGLRHLYWGLGAVEKGTNVFISFFLGITIGPVILTLLELLDKEKRDGMQKFHRKTIYLKKDEEYIRVPNPFKILTKKELAYSTLASILGSVTFLLSPVGLTTFFGELFAGRVKEPVGISCGICMEISSSNLYENIDSHMLRGIPLSVALGQRQLLFNATCIYLENNMHLIINIDIVWATLIERCASFAILLQ